MTAASHLAASHLAASHLAASHLAASHLAASHLGAVGLPAWADLPPWLDRTLGPLVRIALLLLVGLVARFLLHRLVDRVTDRIATGHAGLGPLDRHLPTATAILSSTPLLSARREQRARTMASVLKSLTTGVVGAVAALMVVDEFYDITPLLAGAGIVGVAVGLGAQGMIRDFLAGVFVIAEDQYGVGDVVDVGPAGGTVEAVGLRVTRLRDVEGTVWYVRNGEILRVGNKSQGWARAVVDVAIEHGEDVARVKDLLAEVAESVRADPAFADLVVEEPEVYAVEALTVEAVVLRVLMKTPPLEQWAVARELRARIATRFTAEGVRLPPP